VSCLKNLQLPRNLLTPGSKLCGKLLIVPSDSWNKVRPPGFRWTLIACSLLALLVSAFLDNIRGPLLPFFSRVLGRPYGEISWLLSLGNLAAVATNLTLMPLVAKSGTLRIAKRVWMISVLAVALAFTVSTFSGLMAWAIVVGAAIAGMGSMCNLLMILGTSASQRARGFSGLHVMYGLGSFIAPLAVAAVLSRSFSWQVVLWPCFVGLAAWIVLLGKADDGSFRPVAESKPFRMDAGALWLISTFSLYVVGEVTVSTWLSTYLFEARGLTIPETTSYLSGFFALMTGSRLLCSLFLKLEREVLVVGGSLFAAVAFFCLGMKGWTWAFSLTGVFGPVFPVLLARLSRRYGQNSERIMLWVLTSTQLSLGISQLVVGNLTDRFGVGNSYWIAPLVLVLTLGSLFFYLREELEPLAIPDTLTTTRLRR